MISCRKSHLQIEGFLFGSWRHVTGEQEVNLRLYLCKPIYQIQDFVQVCIFRISHFDDPNYTYGRQEIAVQMIIEQWITATVARTTYIYFFQYNYYRLTTKWW